MKSMERTCGKMSKRQQKIDVIKKYINNAAGNWPGYSYGNIPSKQLSNACYSYAGAVEKKDVIGLIDITVLGNGKKGMLFTERKIYYDNGVLGSKGSISYQSISDKKSMPKAMLDVSYNQTALWEMISKLAQIEGATLSGTISEVGEVLGEVFDSVQEVQDVYNKGKELFSALGSLFEDESTKTK